MAATSSLRRLQATPLVPLLAWALTYVAARFALETDLSGGVRTAVALAPALPALLAVGAVMRAVAALDELHRRVHLEALVVAFPLTLLLLMTLGLLELAAALSPEDWSYRHIWPFLVVFYAAGLWRAWRRYL